VANKGAPAAVVPAGMIAVAGYLGALPDDLVPRLGRHGSRPTAATAGPWAPWYTQHKLMRCLQITWDPLRLLC